MYNMGQLKNSIPIAGAIAAILSLTACSDDNPWGNQSDETGTISLTLDTDNDINVTKPMFRSEESGQMETLGNLTTLPKPENFSIKLEKTDGTYSKTWATLTDFKNDAAHGNFKTGTYTITAFYGDKGNQDFDSPYMEATSTFTLLAGQKEDLTLVAELKNSMVKVNYTDGFKAYMQDYYSSLRTEGRSDDIIFTKEETRAAFIEPIDAALTVHFTTRDKGYTGAIMVEEFAPLAKTLHNVTLDVTENDNGNASLQVNFDDSLEEENITIDLTDELFTTPVPVITCEGFTDGATLDMLEGNASDATLKMNVNAEGIIAKAHLIVESDTYTPKWGGEIDLCSATDTQKQQLTDAGISAIGFGFNGTPDKLAFLDLTQYGKNLPRGIHKISLKVEDKTGKVSETSSVTLNSMPIVLQLVGDPAIVYGSGEAVLTMDYNGADPMNDISFTAVNSLGMHVDAPIKSCEENTATRAFETKRYIYTISLPNTTKSSIEIKAYYKKTKEAGKYIVAVTVPAYEISAYDAFSRYAYMKVRATGSTDSSVLAAIVNNIAFKDSRLQIAARDASNGIITVTGLQPGTTYTVESNITGEDSWNSNGSFTTEEELAIPNGKFKSKIVDGISFDNIEVGGKYNVWPVDYQHTSSIRRDIPVKNNGTSVEWATINDFTAYTGASTKNTWFIVPSTYIQNEQVVIKTVGYHHNGTKPETSGGAFNTKYYCENPPEELKSAPGELFLGSYSFDGQEHRTEGIGFASRPTSISFDYKYEPYNGDTGYALIEIIDDSGNKLGSETFTLESATDLTTKTINFSYSSFGKKASKLIVSFKSSTNKESAPISIPSGSALDEDKGLGNKTISANQYKAVATGSVLTIDNVTATYASEPTGLKSAPKRKNSKRR